MTEKPLNPSILEHLRLAHDHVKEAQKLIDDEMQIRSWGFRRLLERTEMMLLKLHVREAKYVKQFVEEIYKASKY